MPVQNNEIKKRDSLHDCRFQKYQVLNVYMFSLAKLYTSKLHFIKERILPSKSIFNYTKHIVAIMCEENTHISRKNNFHKIFNGKKCERPGLDYI